MKYSNRYFSFALLALLIWTSTFSQTQIGGVISTNTTLSLSNSPYVVTNNLLVQQGVTLEIQPGVEMKFNEAIYMQIDGTLRAAGTNSDKIKFTRNTSVNEWGGLDFTDTSTDYDSLSNSGCIMSHCEITYVGRTKRTLITSNCSPRIEYVHFYNNTGDMEFLQGSVQFYNNIVDSIFVNFHNGTVRGNMFSDYSFNWGGQVDLRGNTLFTENQLKGTFIRCFVNETTVITKNIIEDVSYYGAIILVGGDSSTCIKGNTFRNNDINLVITCERHPVVTNNNFMNYGSHNVYWAEQYSGFSNSSCTLPQGSGVYATIDLSNNYWGGLSSAQLDNSIWDFNDDFSLKALIDYSPFYNDSIDVDTADCSCPTLSTNIEPIQKVLDFSIFPNPTSGLISIQVTGLTKYSINIFDSFGRLVKNKHNQNGNQHSIDLSHLSKGIYLIRIKDENGNNQIRKIIKN
ncbi:MAG: T9SS type A sorting domain-containing protein [Flavobacteriales bacterium]|nr:T9SS type A sorting domain-containing protein [Flavobacteriales bacterium]